MDIKQLTNLLAIAKKVSLKAGEAILEIYETEDFSIEQKKLGVPLDC